MARVERVTCGAKEGRSVSPAVERAVGWIESHPFAILTGTVVVMALGFFLTLEPGGMSEADFPDEDSEAPLFV